MPTTNGHGPKRAVLYARVSADEQARNGYSLAQQLETLREYAARDGYEVLEEVSDFGQSGASLEQPAITRLETGQREAQPRTVRRLATALGVEPRQLMKRNSDA
jgi:DNA invertase Pin-like site-specific DNA recombinase